MSKIKVLIVDDSYFMRQSISKILTQDDIEIVGCAKDGKEAVEKTLELKPDIVTMDIEMPVMNGLDSLKSIMKLKPTPVLMLSSLTSEGAEVTLEALSSGAVDFITKRTAFTEMNSIADEILEKVRSIGSSYDIKKQMAKIALLNKFSTEQNSLKPIKNSNPTNKIYSLLPKIKPEIGKIKAVCIGVSTGGPVALQKVLPRIPADYPYPLLIVQHMPPIFTKSLADRLDRASSITVKEAENGEILMPGTAYFAQGGKQMIIQKNGRIEITDKPPDALYTPSVNVTMNSLVDNFSSDIVGIMMTGMGQDGLDSFKKLSAKGGYIISQDNDTCVVAGMSKAVINAKIANEIIELDGIAESISSLAGLHALSM